MKRYDGAYEAFLDALPAGADALRLVDVVTYDPWLAREPFVRWGAMLRGDDVPERRCSPRGAPPPPSRCGAPSGPTTRSPSASTATSSSAP